MSKLVYAFAEGDRSMRDLLGGKGANLAEMTNIGLPVPPGFTVTTEACRHYLEVGGVPHDLEEQIDAALAHVEEQVGRRLGDATDPLLVSVRSGAAFSMPGMMDTVLNIGLSDASVAGLAAAAGDERFAWDSYRRLVAMFGKTVLGVDGELFEHAIDALKAARGTRSDLDLTAEDLRGLVTTFKGIVAEATGAEFPGNPRQQLELAIRAVFDSWNGERAKIYRRQERIPENLGTAVNVQAMVFGNVGMDSGTGVCFTRDPMTGHKGTYGDYLPNAQGEDVVAGIRNTYQLHEMEQFQPDCYHELLAIMARLEDHYRDLCDIEFTVERRKLWMLQTRVGKRTAAAAFRIATQLVDEGVITMDEALARVNGEQLVQLMFPQFDATAKKEKIGSGMAASPGAAVGKAVFDSPTAAVYAERGEHVILVRRETTPDDLSGMIASQGILTSRGGKTSHAAVVARGMGKTCVCGADSLDVDLVDRCFTTEQGLVVREGDVISIDGSTGEVYLGAVPVSPSPVVDYLSGRLSAEQVAGDELVAAVDRIMKHADGSRRLMVRTNADTPEDAAAARAFGAQGIGLTRTEHMFLGDRRQLVENLILSEKGEEREAALAALLPVQRDDFVGILEAMDGLPVVVRLLDPPLHEFLPDLTEITVRVVTSEIKRGRASVKDRRLLNAVRRYHEQNPMLGLRGVRLGLQLPGLMTVQVRALAEAAAIRREAGGNPHVEVMIPLVGSVQELEAARDECRAVIEKVSEEHGIDLDITIGTMIELPRAALTADEIARVAAFFSFGTNDLTQTTWGFSRDDAEASFFPAYLNRGIFAVSPFESLDINGVGALVKIATEKGRAANPGITLGVCGEHGGDPASIHFFESIGLDYVSCSPFRVPVARLEAGRAAVLGRTKTSDTR